MVALTTLLEPTLAQYKAAQEKEEKALRADIPKVEKIMRSLQIDPTNVSTHVDIHNDFHQLHRLCENRTGVLQEELQTVLGKMREANKKKLQDSIPHVTHGKIIVGFIFHEVEAFCRIVAFMSDRSQQFEYKEDRNCFYFANERLFFFFAFMPKAEFLWKTSKKK
jgi:hypothetical protein